VAVKEEIPPALTPADAVAADRVKLATKAEETALKRKYEEALKTIELLERERDAGLSFPMPQPCVIEPVFGSGTNEGTIVSLASDWHAEEEVDPRKLNGLNATNLEIVEERIKRFFHVNVRLTRLLQQDLKIDNMVMGLLGDFISGDIHEEVAEVCLLPPMEAVVFVQDLMAAGIEFIIEPQLRFAGTVGEQASMFFLDPSGNALEFKAFKDEGRLFEK
jgi:hypothetical protein